jgi:signal transduction histidine kinase
VSGVTHEINNPLYGILGTAEFILDEDDPKKMQEHAKSIIEYSKHIATIVREFACYARPASLGNESLVDLNERLDEAVKMVRHGPHFREVRVERMFEPMPHIMARPGELQQVFVNLISNAVQAMDGTGCLTLATQHRENAVWVRITDTGSGIPADVLSRIFDPFFTTKDPGKGTGLGLSIVHKIITKYRGHISVESEVGKGTTFILRFAMQPSDQ